MSYLDPRFNRTVTPWQSHPEFAKGSPRAPFPKHSSGSRQDLHRGWTGNAELSKFGQTTNTMLNNALMYGLYRGVKSDIESHLDHPSIGEPKTESRALSRGGSFGELGPAPRPMPERTERLALPVGRPEGPPKPAFMVMDLTPLRDRDVSAPITQGFAAKLSSARPGAARTTGGSVTLDPRPEREAPRRGPAGMDPRKRGTWLNYQ